MKAVVKQKVDHAVLVRLTTQDYQAMQELSVESDRPMGYLARKMIKSYLKRQPMTSQHT